MGRDKRLLRLAGATLVERNLAILQGLFPMVALSVRDLAQAPPDVPASVEIVPDVVTGSPLAGLASLLARFREPIFALAADVAFADPEAIGRVVRAFADVDVALPIVGDHLEPLHAVYGPACLRHIEDLLERGAHSILDLLPEVRVAEVPFTATRPFFNVNTPGDWDRARLLSEENAARTPDRRRTPVVLGIVGRPNSGKTTLIEQLIPEFTRRGFRVATVKSVAQFDLDTPGKDSWRHARAGADAVTVASSSRLAFVSQLSAEATLADLVDRFFAGFDIVLCEGFRREAAQVVEVFRAGVGHEGPTCLPSDVLALVTDADVPHIRRFAPDDPAALAAFLIQELVI